MKFLREIRLKRGFTLSAWARLLKVDKAMVSRTENHTLNPSAETILKNQYAANLNDAQMWGGIRKEIEQRWSEEARKEKK